MRCAVVALGLLTVGLGGCVTDLRSAQAPSASMGHGLAYQLPDLVYRIDVTRGVSGCVDDPDRTPAYAAGADRTQFSVKAAATAAYVPGRPVLVSYADLGKPTKTTDFKITTYPSGMLKTINVAEDDRSAAVVAQAGKTVIGVGKLALALSGTPIVASSGPGAAPGPKETTETRAMIVCSEEGLTALRLATTAKANLTRKTQDLASASEALGKAASADTASSTPAKPEEAKSAGAKVEPGKGDAAKNEASKTDPAKPAASAEDTLKKAQKAVTDAQKAVEAAQTAYDAATKALSVSSSIRLRPGRQTSPVALKVDAPSAELVAWVQRFLQMKVVEEKTTVSAAGKTTKARRFAYYAFDDALAPRKPVAAADQALFSQAATSMRAAVVPLTSLNVSIVHSMFSPEWATAGSSTDVERDNRQIGDCKADAEVQCGIIYRTVAQGRLQVCRAVDATTCAAIGEEGGAQLLVRDDRNVPQAATLVSLPLHNGVFVSNSLQAAFREDGTIETFAYAKPTAEAEVAMTAINGLIGDVTTAAEEKRDAPLAALKRATDLETARTALDKARYAREDAAKARLATELQSVQGDTTMTEAVTAKVNAQLALEEAEAKLAAFRAAKASD